MPDDAEGAHLPQHHGSRDRPRICFIHMPKCAGTSIINALRHHYPRRNIRRLQTAPARAAAATLNQGLDFRSNILAYHLSEPDAELVFGHYQVTPEIVAAHPEFDFVTILREPVSRFISNYRYSWTRPEWRDMLSGRDIEAFLDGDEAKSFGYNYLRFLGAKHPQTADGIKQAVALLSRFALVGQVERMDVFLNAFERRYGIRLNIGFDNRTPAPQPQLTPHTLERIRALCAPNHALYSYISSRVARTPAP